MSSQIPTMSGREVAKVFKSLGWEFDRQSSSHIVLVKDGERAILSISDHKEVRKGILGA